MTPISVTARDAAYHVTNLLGKPCHPATIRQWAKRGHIQRIKTVAYGTAVYNLADILQTAQKTAKI